MISHKLISPLRVCYYVTKKGEERWFTLNLNQYRNAQYHILNDSKIKYKELMNEQIQSLPVFTKPVKIKYTVFFRTAKLFDVSNVCCIVDKYFVDALVEAGKLPDDNYKYVPEVIYCIGSIDRLNPRVEIEITEGE